MKTSFLIIAFFALFFAADAQKIHATLFGGIVNYQGDLQPKRFTFDQSHPAVGVGLLYEITEQLYARGNITLGKVSGDDRKNPKYATRNLSFSTPITDIHLGLEYDIINSYQNSLTPYIFAGVSIFKFNPSAVDTAGKKTFLQPLGTEGQGFYPGRKPYSLTSFALPFGGGIKLALTENIRVRVEVGLRKAFTDYIDDVSTTYVDQATLLANNGQRAVDLAFRGDELKTGLTYPNPNTIRGNPKSKDWYYFTGLGVSFRLGTGNSNGGSGGGGKPKTGCPVNVY